MRNKKTYEIDESKIEVEENVAGLTRIQLSM
jgi:hypothetical protein